MVEFYWSATKFNAANYCDMRYYLRYKARFPSLRISAYVKGSLLHELVENFHKSLGTREQVESSSKKFKDKKYHDANSFTEHLKGKWFSIMKADELLTEKYNQEKNVAEKVKLYPHLIIWAYKSEPYAILNGLLPRLGPPLFETLISRGQPTFSEIPFDFKIDEERFKGRIDEVRLSENGEIQVIDYKSGKPWVGEMKLAHDPQLTLYNAGLCALLKFDPKIRKVLGIECKFEDFMAGQRFISPKIKEGFFMIESLAVDPEKVKSMPEVIYETTRTDQNFFELLKMAKSVKKRADDGDVYPERGKKCDTCDMKEACDKQIAQVNTGHYFDKHNHGVFDFDSPMYAKKDNIGEISFATADTILPSENEEVQLQVPDNKTQSKFRFQYKRGGHVCGQASKK